MFAGCGDSGKADGVIPPSPEADQAAQKISQQYGQQYSQQYAKKGARRKSQ